MSLVTVKQLKPGQVVSFECGLERKVVKITRGIRQRGAPAPCTVYFDNEVKPLEGYPGRYVIVAEGYGKDYWECQEIDKIMVLKEYT
jgi:hypothetical protein